MQDLPLPDHFRTNLPAQVTHFAPGGWGGNHWHQRQEAYVGIDDGLFLVWREADGFRHEAKMFEADHLQLFVIPPLVPHLIENRSQSEPAVVYELMDRYDRPAEPLTGEESLRS